MHAQTKHQLLKHRMAQSPTALDIKVPRGLTAVMQQLLMLVVLGHKCWCGGVVSPEKLQQLVNKFDAQYPIARLERGRSYDRSKGLASVHLIVFPRAGKVHWWLLSSAGKGGLADPCTPDAHVSKDTMSADGHIELADYVLLYATKENARKLKDSRTGKEKVIVKNTSTWTWKMRRSVINEVKANVDREVSTLSYGEEEADRRKAWGLRGVLQFQRCRPLFGGIRQEVLDLHKYADEKWGQVRSAWVGHHTELAKKYGSSAGALRSLKDVRERHLPKMQRMPVYGDTPITVRDLCKPA